MHLRQAFAVFLSALAGLATPAAAAAHKPSACSPDVFLQARQLDVGVAPSGLVTADFNGDGIPDLAVTGAYFDLNILLGIGDGTFAPPIVVDGASNESVAAGDFDGDGKQDLALGRIGDVAVYRGKGDGTFENPVIYPATGGGIRFLAAADLTGDGKPDIVADEGSDVAVLLNDGSGVFGPVAHYPIGSPTSAGNGFAVGDLDGDGQADIVGTNGEISVLHNLGGGTFGSPDLVQPGGALSVALGDVNGDGIVDIGYTIGNGESDPSGYVGVMIGTGNGAFLAAIETFVGFAPNHLILRDLDLDGNVDAAVILGGFNYGSNYAAVLEGTGTAGFGFVTQYFAGNTAVDMAAADFDGDGQMDLATANYYAPGLSLLFGNGVGRLRSLISIQPYAGATGPLPGDVDSDGIVDVMASGSQGQPVLLLRGNGDGTFSPPELVTVDGPAQAMGDFDGDLNLDLVVGSDAGSMILLGKGDGTFHPGVTGLQIAPSAAVDLDGDGVLDLIGIENAGNGFLLAAALGHGDGSFGTVVSTPLATVSYGLALGDVNGDGKADVGYFSTPGVFQPEVLHVLLGSGDGTFTESYTRTTDPAANWIVFANVSGHVDLFTSQGPTGTMYSQGHGDGTFDDPVILDARYGSSLAVADFDGDATPDLVIATNADPEGQSFLRGLGGGTFAAPVGVSPIGAMNYQVVALAGSSLSLLYADGGGTFRILLNSRLAPRVADRSAAVGERVALSASASGYGALTYAWAKNGVPLSDGGSISGAHAPTLVIDPASFSDAGTYDVLVTDSCATVASNTSSLAIEFVDVPVSSIFHSDILTVATAGITAGCGAAHYCPIAPVRRDQMAVFLLKSEHGSNYTPPLCTGHFDDVPCPGTFADWIEQLSAEGVTGGCGGNDYCPENPVTRAQMAVFLLKTSLGGAYAPPAAVGVFGDVPPGAFAADFIEALYNKGISGGCSASPLLYCPGNSVLRQQMATFLVRTFGLP